MNGTSTTRRGLASPRPAAGVYDAPMVEAGTDSPLIVRFAGRDGRARDYDFATLALPQLAGDLAAAFAARTGTTGTLHTLASANNCWNAIRRFVEFLARLADPPGDLRQVTPSHLRRFRLERLSRQSELPVMGEMTRIGLLLAQIPEGGLVESTRAYLGTGQYTTGRTGHEGVAGYSDEVFVQIMRAARRDVAAIRDRIRAGGHLLAQHAAGLAPEPLRERAALVARMAESGVVPTLLGPGQVNPSAPKRLAFARQLFLTSADIAPLMVLGIGLSGRNGESVKELTAEHVLLDDRAVQVRVVKRRRGAGHWFAEAVWEIGEPSRTLHTPGGFYLLMLELTARSRTFSGSRSIWSVWLGGSVAEKLSGGRHVDPFAANLSRDLDLGAWARRHALTEDGAPLTLSANRLKTTVERRTTRAVGGHLPSAVRTNTQDVLFASYLAGDATVRDWAEEVIAESVAEAEAAARDAHRRTLEPGGGRIPVVQASRATRAQATAFASCTDIAAGPFNQGVCRASFLACFACRNAVVTAEHLPGLLELREAAEARYPQLPAGLWWRRYGQAWLAITEDVLPAFTPAQLDHAATQRTGRATRMLDLLEGPAQ